MTQALDHALQLAGLWYRDLAASRRARPSSCSTATAAPSSKEDAGARQTLRTAQELVDDTRTRLILNVSEELACEAFAYRLEETLCGVGRRGVRPARPGRSSARLPVIGKAADWGMGPGRCRSGRATRPRGPKA